MKAPDYHSILRRIDDDNARLRQQINVLKVEIADGEEARRKILHLMEKEEHEKVEARLRAQYPELQRLQEQPLLIVRDAPPAEGFIDRQIREVKAKKPRSDKGVARPKGPTGRRAAGTGKKARFMEAIRTLMKDGKPRMGGEIMEALGVHNNKVEKQSVYNAISYLKLQTKELQQSQFGEPYTMVRQANGQPLHP